jgi:hypothetical protein
MLSSNRLADLHATRLCERPLHIFLACVDEQDLAPDAHQLECNFSSDDLGRGAMDVANVASEVGAVCVCTLVRQKQTNADLLSIVRASLVPACTSRPARTGEASRSANNAPTPAASALRPGPTTSASRASVARLFQSPV